MTFSATFNVNAELICINGFKSIAGSSMTFGQSFVTTAADNFNGDSVDDVLVSSTASIE